MAACLAMSFDAGNEFRALSRGKGRSQRLPVLHEDNMGHDGDAVTLAIKVSRMTPDYFFARV